VEDVRTGRYHIKRQQKRKKKKAGGRYDQAQSGQKLGPTRPTDEPSAGRELIWERLKNLGPGYWRHPDSLACGVDGLRRRMKWILSVAVYYPAPLFLGSVQIYLIHPWTYLAAFLSVINSFVIHRSFFVSTWLLFFLYLITFGYYYSLGFLPRQLRRYTPWSSHCFSHLCWWARRRHREGVPQQRRGAIRAIRKRRNHYMVNVSHLDRVLFDKVANCSTGGGQQYSGPTACPTGAFCRNVDNK